MENTTTESDVQTADEPPAKPVGLRLREAREASRLSLEELAQRLKLGVRQLEALEKGDWDRLPGHTFIRGFVRNYARQVGLDAEPLCAQIDGLVARPADVLGTQSPQSEAVSFSSRPSARDRRLVFAGAGVLALAVALYALLPHDLEAWRNDVQRMVEGLSRQEASAPGEGAPAPAAGSTAEPVFPPGTTPQQVMTPQALLPAEPVAATQGGDVKPQEVKPIPAPAMPAAVNGRPVLEFVADKMAWVEVKDREGRVIFSQRLAAGSSQSVNGEGPLSIVIGYAPGVRLNWRGQAVDLEPHTRGDVARLVLE